MRTFPLRLLGLALLVVAIVVPSCQALLQRGSTVNPPPTFERSIEN
jgi:hypothetical protein